MRGDEEGISPFLAKRLLELRSGSRQKKISRAKRLFCQLAVRKMGYPGAEVARFLGVTTSAVIRAANSEEVPELENS